MDDVLRHLDARIARAGMLADEHPAAGELLRFHAEVARYQRALLRDRPLPAVPARREAPFRDALDTDASLDAIPPFLAWLPSRAPARLAEAAGILQTIDRGEWREAMHAYASSEAPGDPEDSVMRFVVAAVLQPFAEQLAAERRAVDGARGPTPDGARGRQARGADAHATCPICDSLPVLGVLRPEGQGARRSLVCALCLSERDYMRVVCPACGERRFEALPIYTAGQYGHVRIEACDQCRTYLKTIDLTVDGLAVPVVDDIASVSLDLWARDRGYVRLRRNLLGM